jgi:hypothetical protein
MQHLCDHHSCLVGSTGLWGKVRIPAKRTPILDAQLRLCEEPPAIRQHPCSCPFPSHVLRHTLHTFLLCCVLRLILSDILWRGSFLVCGVQPYRGSLDALSVRGLGRRENSTGRDAWSQRANRRLGTWQPVMLSSATRTEGTHRIHSAFSPWAARLRWARNSRSCARCVSPASRYASPARRNVSAMSR